MARFLFISVASTFDCLLPNLVHYSELTVVGVPVGKVLDAIGIVERGEGVKVVIQP